MRIRDYEHRIDLKDVELALTPEEAEELLTTLSRLLHRPDIGKVHLSDVRATRLERELTVRLDHAAQIA